MEKRQSGKEAKRQRGKEAKRQRGKEAKRQRGKEAKRQRGKETVSLSNDRTHFIVDVRSITEIIVHKMTKMSDRVKERKLLTTKIKTG